MVILDKRKLQLFCNKKNTTYIATILVGTDNETRYVSDPTSKGAIFFSCLRSTVQSPVTGVCHSVTQTMLPTQNPINDFDNSQC